MYAAKAEKSRSRSVAISCFPWPAYITLLSRLVFLKARALHDALFGVTQTSPRRDVLHRAGVQQPVKVFQFRLKNGNGLECA